MRVFWEDPNEFFQIAWSMSLLPDADHSDVLALESLMRESSSGEMAAAIFAARDRMDVRSAAEGLDVPALIAHARDDRVVPFESALELVGLLPRASLLALDSANHVLLPGSIWDRFVAETTRFIGVTSAKPPTSVALSARERDVLGLVADGNSNEEIAGRLALSTRTVERHLSNIYTKLGVSGRSARAAAAARFHDL